MIHRHSPADDSLGPRANPSDFFSYMHVPKLSLSAAYHARRRLPTRVARRIHQRPPSPSLVLRKWPSIRQALEGTKDGPSVRHTLLTCLAWPEPLSLFLFFPCSRTYLQPGVKTKRWEDRMEKEKKERAIKKLQQELKDEKIAEKTRCAFHPPFGSC
jgi:hypothetical protein